MGIFGKKKDESVQKKSSAPKASKKDAAPKDVAKAAAPVAATGRKGGSAEASAILVRPMFTEKTERLQASGKYTFIVSRDANKTEVARAVRAIYGVTPVSVHMSVMKGKPVTFARISGHRKDAKKAVVTLKPGEKITVMQA